MAKNAPLARKFDALLDALKFGAKNNKGVRKKTIKGRTLKVDFANERIIYGEGIRVGDQTTSNFSHEENLVVLECVHCLLKKGYKPEHLTLEPKWTLGRTSSGGKADILVRDHDGKTMLIIECKTWGAEFDKEQKRMLAGGGQLFSYLQQDKNAKYLCLYASDIDNGIVKYKNAIVKIQDREEDIKARHEDDSVKLYRDANTAVELYEVWKERFNLYFHYNGIFEKDVNAYKIELKPLKKKDLLPFSEAEGVFNRFAEILRHNNISDNANAFNRVLSLLLCKMVDEGKDDNDVLDFQVKEGEDTPEKIHDRLQNLYQTGMKKYLLEDVVYHSDNKIAEIIAQYPDQTPLEEIREMFREIKYYTNNEFAFKEVHNKELFEQNSRVLNEVIKMLQNYQFKYTKKDPILGNFFELMLNHGVKQSEGQFFTPVPLVRFILLSIGLERVIDRKLADGETNFLPKILDYACGAGHFLTESIDELQKHLKAMPDKANGNEVAVRAINKTLARYRESTEWAKDYIFGVEKDYRLARTSQIACFINGDGEANIIFGDGLENHDKLRDAGKFDLVVANPPYSVKAFKNYLRVPEGQYTLMDRITETAREIEVLFLERTAQMLAVGGVAGIIMPVSMLTANEGIYAAARKLMLEKFEIKAVAEFGEKTFYKTDTKTVVLFLQRRSDDFAKDCRYISADLFAGKIRPRERDIVDSEKLLADFAEKERGLSLVHYKTLISGKPDAVVRKSGWFENYRAEKSEGEAEKQFLAKLLQREQEKFYYYLLCLDGEFKPQRLVSVKSGDDKNEQKEFLGFFHSTRKGKEGMKILQDADGKYGGKMYDDYDHRNPAKASSYILANIWGDAPVNIDDSLQNNVSRALLVDCLDFDDAQFTATIHAKIARAENGSDTEDTWSQQIIDRAKWPIVQLHSKMRTVAPPFKFPKSQFASEGKFPIIDQSQNEIAGWTNDESKLVTDGLPAVIFGDHTCCVKYAATPFAQGADGIKIITTAKELSPKFLYHWLQSAALSSDGYQRHFSLLKRRKIPLPPLPVQDQIVEECDGIDHSVESVLKETAQLRAAIAEIIGAGKPGAVSDLVTLSKETTKPFQSPDAAFRHIGLEHIQSDTGELLSREKVLGRTLRSSKRLFQKGDVLYGQMRPYLNKVHIAEFDGVCSSTILVLKTSEPLFIKHALLQKAFVEAATGKMQGTRPVIPVNAFIKLQIPLPPAKAREAASAKILKKDNRIKELSAETAKAQERKIAVLKKHLQ